jgi:hypothetical protein
MYKDSIRISQETRYISSTKHKGLFLFTEKIAAYRENHKKHTNTLCGKNAEL